MAGQPAAPRVQAQVVRPAAAGLTLAELQVSQAASEAPRPHRAVLRCWRRRSCPCAGTCSAKCGAPREAVVSPSSDTHQQLPWGCCVRRSSRITRRVRWSFVSVFLSLPSVLLVSPADAGPCTQEIAAYEQALRELPGTTGHQSVHAQLHHQPTPDALARSESRAAGDERED